MFALVIFGILIAYFALAVFSVRAAVCGARESGLPQKQRWIRGSLVALVFYLIPFWDWIPTVVAHEYYCATEAKFEVFKTIEQWNAENVDVVPTLRFDRNAVPHAFGNVDRYLLNQRIVSDRDPRTDVFLSVRREQARAIDIKNGQVLASYVDFGAGYASFGVGGDGAWKFWLKRDSCSANEKSPGRAYADYKAAWINLGGASK
jgi:hypothetical protein